MCREADAVRTGGIADPDEMLVFNGAAEALLALFSTAAEPGANIVVPTPSFAPFFDL